MTDEELSEIRKRYAAMTADIDSLIAEIELLKARAATMNLRMEGVHNLLLAAGISCGTFCEQYAKRVESGDCDGAAELVATAARFSGG